MPSRRTPSPAERRVVITGMGMVTPYGLGTAAYWDGISNGVSATRALTSFEPRPEIPCHVVADVPDFHPEDFISHRDLTRVPRVVPMTIAAAREALVSSGLLTADEVASGPERGQTHPWSVVIGSAGGGIEFAEIQYLRWFEGRILDTSPYAVSSSIVGMLSSELSIAFALHGRSHTISDGCTSSSDALAYAADTIRLGRADVVLSGGADACITPGILAGYCLMKAVPTHFNDRPWAASRPFTADREGFVFGEGAWIFVLEALDHAEARGATILAELVGSGSTCDAFHRVSLRGDGGESARAMTLAMDEAGVAADEIDYVNLHGTSTPLNDIVETNAVKLALGEEKAYQTPLSATKSLIGHPQGASGAAGLAATLLSMRHSFIHPTINLDNPDPACDLDYVPLVGRPAEIRTALCNCVGFGSKNTALVVRSLAD